ncbi:MAG TPA: biliverdin-producing heme oxygenase [Pseudolysinimonas sp.]|nr:biliverdin-producing heme oxygenase [Pseudolysinimonas sp.]
MPLPLTDAPVRDVAALVRDASSADHRAAESRGFITRLMAGELSLDDYGRYLAQLLPIYDALERDRPPLEIFDHGFDRGDAIRADLRALGAEHHALVPATVAYAGHLAGLTDLSGRDGIRYLAHHYTRYLGDLSGGQAIAALVARHYGATAEQLTVFRFDGLGKPVDVKRAYRDRLNALSLDDDQVELLVSEVRIAFRMTADVFDQL